MSRPPVSTEWLLADPSTAGPLMWLEKFVRKANRLSDPGPCPERLLTDDEIESELRTLIDTSKYALEFITDEAGLEEAVEGLNRLRLELDEAVRRDETLSKCIARGLEQDSEALKTQNHYNSLQIQRNTELTELIQEYGNVAQTLNQEKNNLVRALGDQSDGFISIGMNNEYQLDEKQYADYFASSENLISFFDSHIAVYEKEMESNERSSAEREENKRDLESLQRVHNMIESSIFNYIKVKAQLNQEQEFLKFLLSYSDTDTLVRDVSRKFINVEKILSEKDTGCLINSFVKHQVAFLIHGELKIKLVSIKNTYELVDKLSSSLKDFRICSEKNLFSIATREQIINDVINAFFSNIQTLIADIDLIDMRMNAINQCTSSILQNQSSHTKELLNLKAEIYRIFEINDDTPIEGAVKIIELKLSNLNKLKHAILYEKNNSILSQCTKNKGKLSKITNFIFDGAAFQPNILNKEIEKDLHLFEKEINCYVEKAKIISNKYRKLKEMHKCDSTLKHELL